MFPQHMTRGHRLPGGLNEDLIEQLDELLHQGRIRRSQGLSPANASALKTVADAAKPLPEWMLEAELVDYAAHRGSAGDSTEDLGEVRRWIERFVDERVEFHPLSLYTSQIRILWYTRVRRKAGRVIYGRAKKLSARDRILSGGMLWDIELSLVAWALMSSANRGRLVHHELMHLDMTVTGAALRAHDIEEFTATTAAFGPTDDQLPHAHAAASHPRFQATRTEGWKAEAAEQGWLFAPEPVGRWT